MIYVQRCSIINPSWAGKEGIRNQARPHPTFNLWKYSFNWKLKLVCTFRMALYLLMTVCHSDKSLQNHFDKLFPKVWNNCAFWNYDYLLQRTIYMFPGIFRSWNLHRGYPLVKTVAQWRHQIGHVIFPKNVFRFCKLRDIFDEIH